MGVRFGNHGLSYHLNMTLGGKKGAVTHSRWTKAMSILVVKLSSLAKTKNGISVIVRFQVESHVQTLPRSFKRITQ